MGCVQHGLAEDHAWLDKLLQRVMGEQDRIDHQAYSEFRKELFRHIAAKETGAVSNLSTTERRHFASLTDKLRFDHGALGTFIMPTPTRATIN